MNPALPTVVYLIPNCWKLLARQSRIPQQIPPVIRVLRSEGVCSLEDLVLPSPQMTGSSAIAPMIFRTALKVKPPI